MEGLQTAVRGPEWRGLALPLHDLRQVSNMPSCDFLACTLGRSGKSLFQGTGGAWHKWACGRYWVSPLRPSPFPQPLLLHVHMCLLGSAGHSQAALSPDSVSTPHPHPSNLTSKFPLLQTAPGLLLLAAGSQTAPVSIHPPSLVPSQGSVPARPLLEPSSFLPPGLHLAPLALYTWLSEDPLSTPLLCHSSPLEGDGRQ